MSISKLSFAEDTGSKNQVGKIWIFSLQKSILKSIFAGYTGSKNPVRNRLKIQFVKPDFSKLIFQKSSTDQQGATVANWTKKSDDHRTERVVLCTFWQELWHMQLTSPITVNCRRIGVNQCLVFHAWISPQCRFRYFAKDLTKGFANKRLKSSAVGRLIFNWHKILTVHATLRGH